MDRAARSLGSPEASAGEHAAGEVRRADAVAREAERVVDRRAVERADLRQVARGDVDRAAPGVRDRAALERREHRDQVAAGLLGDLGVDLDAPAQPRARREPPAAPAERDPAVARGAEVVHERARVGDALAAGPADRLEHVGDRLGQHDVRRGDREPVAQRPEPARGGVDRQHRARPRARARPRSRPRPRRGAACSARTRERSWITARAAVRAGRARAARAGRSRRRARPARAGSAASRSARAAPAPSSARDPVARRGGDDARRSRASCAGAVEAIR